MRAFKFAITCTLAAATAFLPTYEASAAPPSTPERATSRGSTVAPVSPGTGTPSAAASAPSVSSTTTTPSAVSQAVREVPSDLAVSKYQQGSIAYEEGRYEDAIVALQESLRLRASPSPRLVMAHCFQKLGRFGTAYVLYRQAAQEAGAAVASGDLHHDKTRTSAYMAIAEVEPKVPRVVLAVPSEVPSDFAVAIDGKELPRDTWGIGEPIDPGPHQVVVTGSRLQRIEENIEVKAGELRRLDLKPIRLATAIVRLVFKTRPTGIALEIDGRPVQPDRTDGPHYLDPGKHRIVVSAPGYKSLVWTRNLKDGEQPNVEVALASAAGTPKWLFATGTILTVAALGTGIGFGAVAKQREDAIRPDPNTPWLYPTTERDQIRQLATNANIAFGIAGAFGLASMVLAITTDWRGSRLNESSARSKPVAWLLPTIAPQSTGIALGGDF